MADKITVKVENDMKLDYIAKEFLSPRYIFIPIKKNSKLKVKDNSYVYKNDIVLFEGNVPVRSTVSGKVLGVKDALYCNNKSYPSVIIENDFKEDEKTRKSAKKYINRYSINDFKDILESFSYTEILNRLNKGTGILLINCIELDPFFGNKYFMIKDNVDELLEVIDLITELYQYKKVIIAIKNSETDIINEFYDYVGTYPNIELKLMNNYYPIGHSQILKDELNINNSVTLDIKDIYELYFLLKKRTSIGEKYITITGDAVNPRMVIKVKKYSLLSEAFINNFDFIEKMVDLYINGFLSGYKSNTLNVVITDDINGIFLAKQKDNKPKDCANCGLCSKYCPLKLNPKYVLDNKKMPNEFKNKCINCGLCNYLCPSMIDLRSIMNGDINEEKE